MLTRFACVAAALLLTQTMARAEEPAVGDQVAPTCTQNGAPMPDTNLAAARDLMASTRASDRMNQIADAMMPMMLDMLHKTAPDIPNAAIDDFKTALHDEILKGTPTLIELEACLYARHYSLDDMKALGAFYKSPIGKKMLAEAPDIAKESIAIGGAWGERMGRAAMERVMAKYKKTGDKT